MRILTSRLHILHCLAVFAFVNGSAHGEEISRYSIESSKAPNLRIEISYPSSWTPGDSRRPGVLHEFRNRANGGRDALIVVMPDERVTDEDAFFKALEREDAKDHIMPGAQHLGKKALTIEGRRCVYFDYNLPIPQFMPAVVQVRNYIFVFQNKQIQVQFYAIDNPETDVRVSRESLMTSVIQELKVSSR